MSSKRLPGRPLMIVISSPSGGGKSTLCSRLVKEYDGIDYSISCTTRAPRGDEKHGVSYYFLSRGEFEERIEKGEFLEHAEVHGNLYGTLRETVEVSLTAGRSVILDIDVQGAAQIRGALGGDDLLSKSFIDVFIAPPSLDVLRERLEKRGEDAASVIDVRMINAAEEMRCAPDYRYVIENDVLERAYGQFEKALEEASLS